MFHVFLLEKDLSKVQNGDDIIKNIDASVEKTKDEYDIVEDIVDSKICKKINFTKIPPAGLYCLIY